MPNVWNPRASSREVRVMTTKAQKREAKKGNDAVVLKILSFSSWVLMQCLSRKDVPNFIDEYLHEMVDEWYQRGDPK